MPKQYQTSLVLGPYPRFSHEHLPHFLINSHQGSNLLGKGDTGERNKTEFSHLQLPTAQVAASQNTDYRSWHCKFLCFGKVCICQMEVEGRFQQGCPCNSCPKRSGLQSTRVKFQFACRYTWCQVCMDSCIGTTNCDTQMVMYNLHRTIPDTCTYTQHCIPNKATCALCLYIV